MAENFILGKDAKLYYKEGGVEGAGEWNELNVVRDVNFNMEKATADVTTRAAGGWRQKAATLKEGSVETEMVWAKNNLGFQATKAAFLDDLVIGLRVLTGPPEDGGEGLEADYMVTNFSRAEPLEEAVTAAVTFEIAFSETPPVWIEP